MSHTGVFQGNPATGRVRDEDYTNRFFQVHGADEYGKPVGDRAWLQALEKRTGRSLMPGKRGLKANATE